MIPRQIASLLAERLADYPALAMVGLRQCGKTTLARSLGGLYFDLEQEVERTRFDIEFDRVVASDRLVVLDEAQTAPEVFVRLHGAIGDRRGNRSGPRLR